MSGYGEYMDSMKRQGYLNELSAKEVIGGDAVILDQVPDLGLGGGRFPTYDISSSTEIASAAAYVGSDTKLTFEAVSRYTTKFGRMFGWSREPNAVQEDAKRIAMLRDSGVPVPGELKEAKREEIAEYLGTKSVLRIPNDHVDEIRRSLKSDVRRHPGNYFLHESPSEEQIASVTSRVKGSGMTSAEILERMRKSTKYEDLLKKQKGREPNLSLNMVTEESESDDYSHGYGH